MNKLLLAAAVATTLGLFTGATLANATVGQPAPAFTATDTSGKAVSLADFKGKHVVLEWVNPGCPYVVKHYGSANMQGTQKEATAKGVVWLTVNSTAPEHSDYKAPAALAQWMQSQKAAASATLMDPDGKVGRAYGARTTPHMYIVDPKGVLVYAGGIDNKPSSNPADVATATNHVKVALAETLAGKPVTQAATRPYGCSVKYPSGA
ncbi:MAG: thioredoxin family protein [Rubrivivax sp.]|nr:thioredoxin family protein [Rubrivivax sp.]